MTLLQLGGSVLVLFLVCLALRGLLSSPPDLRVLVDRRIVEVNAYRSFLAVTCPSEVKHLAGLCGCALAEEES